MDAVIAGAHGIGIGGLAVGQHVQTLLSGTRLCRGSATMLLLIGGGVIAQALLA